MDAQNILEDRTGKAIRTLFKGFLGILEDVQREHDINFDKLRESFPDEESLINMADYLDEDRFSAYRKKVLDLGNSILREHQAEMENFTIEFRFKE